MRKHLPVYSLLIALMAAGILVCMLFIALMFYNARGMHIPEGAQLVREVTRFVNA